MNINKSKNKLGLIRDKRFHQGYYKPVNPNKCLNIDYPIYRSSIELKFFKFCDNNINVIKWMSEPLPIPYYDTVKKTNRKYFIDNYVEILENGILKKYLIELKDIKETIKPNTKSKKRKTTLLFEQLKWENNHNKWSAANKFCKNNGMEFMLIGYSNKSGFEFIPLQLN